MKSTDQMKCTFQNRDKSFYSHDKKLLICYKEQKISSKIGIEAPDRIRVFRIFFDSSETNVLKHRKVISLEPKISMCPYSIGALITLNWKKYQLLKPELKIK